MVGFVEGVEFRLAFFLSNNNKKDSTYNFPYSEELLVAQMTCILFFSGHTAVNACWSTE